MEKVIAGYSVDVTEEGYLTNQAQWNKEIAWAIAKEIGINELTEGHWKVIEFLQKDFAETEKMPTIRRVKNAGGIATKELYALFPEGPILKAAKIAGLSKPVSCV
ncbi:TusE/DsrC/DsvC family sulfur relay protein [Desulfosporosinus sp. BICA1-9]|uniref:TusE/DsrC/DsvC family sulfur relay protein n=1 Tax=Desulfosporosinus sp. BICA1-9 TaxID=1531958 RepID=UPI00054BD3AD|nr:TusE/DsrC/DsvC family sulfur relay protein [Desulfosporosinus sp. BICA1-9]KJS50520.1 MAG: sulfur relay protein DsrC [Peptococcaceae bacterium BRH_c23]KJS81731.1 MAG: sulfur relay protein DsrC [Desulfosporosinus sp. BICA1-9]HBW36123.1 TusE/DsrC/DsvC family sulfur relay protein [Desulfosporosinus sp.]